MFKTLTDWNKKEKKQFRGKLILTATFADSVQISKSILICAIGKARDNVKC